MPRSGYLSVEKNLNNIFAPSGATYLIIQQIKKYVSFIIINFVSL